MSIQSTALVLSSASQGCCRKRKHDLEETEIVANAESGKPHFSSTTFRQRWIESLKTAGNRFRSHLSSQAIRIKSLWTWVTCPVIAPPQTPPIRRQYSSTSLINAIESLRTAYFRRDKARESLNSNQSLADAEKKCKSLEDSLSTMLSSGSVDLFEQDPWRGYSAFYYAIWSKNIEIMKILTQTTSHKAFDSCKDIHDFFEVLFPSCKDRLPPNWKQLKKSAPQSAELQEFEKRMAQKSKHKKKDQNDPVDKETTFKNLEKEFNGLLAANPNKNPIELLTEYLTNQSFALGQAWELANKQEKVTLLEIPETSFFTSGKRVGGPKGPQGRYRNTEHSIGIGKEAPFSKKYECLIFEIFNALQRSTFGTTKDGSLEREDYTFQEEWIEMRSWSWAVKWKEEPGKDPIRKVKLLKQKIAEIWKSVNTSEEPNTISHAESYRHQWDDHMAIKYLESNKGFLKRRLKELESAESIPQTPLS